MSANQRGEVVTEFDQLADEVGSIIASTIRNRWGGQPLYVPRNMAPDHPIAITVGLDCAKVLVEKYGGSWIEYIPKRDKTERDEEIIRLRQNGLTIVDIATEFGLSKRLVQQVCEGVKPERRGRR